jgi:hypothetical protein
MSRFKLSIRFIPLLALTAALYGSSLACTSNIPVLGRTKTPTPTVTPTVTDTPTASQTPTVTETATAKPSAPGADWPVIFSDSFDDNRNGWLEGNFDDEFVKGTITFSGGKYRFALAAKQGVYYWSVPGLRALTDFFTAVDVRKTSGYSDSHYGMIFRVGENAGYFFTIDADDQEYHIDLVIGANWSLLKEPTSTAGINKTGANRIAVLAEGSQFTFFINGEEVFSVVNGSLPEGVVGVGVMQFTIGETVDIEFDNYEVRAPAG